MLRLVTGAGQRYSREWHFAMCDNAKTLDDIIATLRAVADNLEKLRADGVELARQPHRRADRISGVRTLFTFDPEVARKYHFDAEE
jgi:hypothetical protein